MVIQAEHAAAEQFYVSISDEEFWEAMSGPSRVMKHGSGVMGPDNKLNLYRWRGGGSLQYSNGHFIIHVLCYLRVENIHLCLCAHRVFVKIG